MPSNRLENPARPRPACTERSERALLACTERSERVPSGGEGSGGEEPALREPKGSG
jgi:hypothetical protein